jgi:hypothetical protein
VSSSHVEFSALAQCCAGTQHTAQIVHTKTQTLSVLATVLRSTGDVRPSCSERDRHGYDLVWCSMRCHLLVCFPYCKEPFRRVYTHTCSPRSSRAMPQTATGATALKETSIVLLLFLQKQNLAWTPHQSKCPRMSDPALWEDTESPSPLCDCPHTARGTRPTYESRPRLANTWKCRGY